MRAPWRVVRVRHYEPTASPVARGVVAVAAIAVTVLLVVQAVDAWGSGGRLALMIGTVAVTFQLLALVRWPGTAAPAALLLGLLAGVAVLPTANRGLAVQMVVLFLAATELTSWAVRLRSVIPETAASLGRQVGTLGAVVAGGGLVAAGLLAVGHTTSAPSGRTALLLGLAGGGGPRRPAGLPLVAERAVKADSSPGSVASSWWRSPNRSPGRASPSRPSPSAGSAAPTSTASCPPTPTTRPSAATSGSARSSPPATGSPTWPRATASCRAARRRAERAPSAAPAGRTTAPARSSASSDGTRWRRPTGRSLPGWPSTPAAWSPCRRR